MLQSKCFCGKKKGYCGKDCPNPPLDLSEALALLNQVKNTGCTCNPESKNRAICPVCDKDKFDQDKHAALRENRKGLESAGEIIARSQTIHSFFGKEFQQGMWTRAQLRDLVDEVWMHAFQDQSVPSTSTADMLIDKVLNKK